MVIKRFNKIDVENKLGSYSANPICLFAPTISIFGNIIPRLQAKFNSQDLLNQLRIIYNPNIKPPSSVLFVIVVLGDDNSEIQRLINTYILGTGQKFTCRVICDRFLIEQNFPRINILNDEKLFDLNRDNTLSSIIEAIFTDFITIIYNVLK